MLLPSDVARLVLGYLQQEKLTSTCRAFVAESPNLKEYAEQHTDDGTLPGCLLSLFGKNLTTILNEYVTLKAKENEAEIPLMMSSLWKKLDLTLSQIRCMQESAAFQTNQRARTRRGINDRMRQNMLTSTPVSGSPLSHAVVQQTSTPIIATQYILQPINTPGASQSVSTMLFNGHSTMQSSNPVSSNPVSSNVAETTQTVSVASTQRKITTATSSPMRRKPDNQRRRRIVPTGSSSTTAERDAGLDMDTIQGLIDDDFPQLVIENAREKILSNKSLQEKLADSINKILASDTGAQTSKQGDGAAVEQDVAIDEILGLQGGEIHMSEEAIHDILAQTELDPDFQELYDLFACVSSKAPKNPTREASSQSIDTRTSGSEKGRKQDVVEEGSSRDCIGNKMDDCTKEKEATSKSNSGTSSTRKDGNSNSQLTCMNEATTSGDQSPKGDKLSTDLVISIDSSDGENVMDSGKESHRPVLEASSSQPQDVEMEIISPADGAEDCCFIIEDVAPQVSVSKANEVLTNMCSDGSGHEEPSVVTIPEEMTNKNFSDMSLQETNDDLATIRLSPTAPHTVGMVVACVAPLDNTSSSQNESHQLNDTSESSPFKKPHVDAANKQGTENEFETSTARIATSQTTAIVNIDHAAPESGVCSTGISAPYCSQSAVDASNIVTLNIITEDLPDDPEINQTVTGINEDYQTIILSPVVNSHEIRVDPSADAIELSITGEQSQNLPSSTDGLLNTINIPNGDCTVYAVSGTSTADGSVIQLMQTPGSTFTPASSLFISSCTNSAPAKQPNIMMLSNSSAVNGQKQANLFQTPPRPGGMYTVGQAISPTLSQGSTILLASPVQPMLQGVMGMIPVSLVGQSGSTFTTQPHQILHVPVSKPMVPKLPLPPKSQKPLPKPAVHSGKPQSALAAESTIRPSASLQRENGDKNSNSETQQQMPDERAVPETVNIESKQVEAHRRVLCFDGTSRTSNSPSSSNVKSLTSNNDDVQTVEASAEAGSSKTSLSKESRKAESSVSPSTGKSSSGDTVTANPKEQHGEKRPTSSSGGSPGNKENMLQTGTEKHGAGQTDKKATSQENVRVEKSGRQQQEVARRQTLPNILRRTPQKLASERVCSTSPLAKQASQLLQDIHFHSPNTKPRSAGDLPIPRTPGSGMEDKLTDHHSEHTRTPICRHYNEEGGTPKPMMPPTTPELPTCSPASEAGSESSVNMAAHTLMILSRASMAKSHTPLKDNTQQSKSSKSTAKKRRLEDSEEYERRSHKKELLSPSSLQKKKKMKKHRKKSSDNFPAGMDVEKFLMSLHYDE